MEPIKNYLRRDALFPFVVLVLSSINVADQFWVLNIPSLIVSIIGLCGVLFYIYRNPKYRVPLYVWMALQLITVSHFALLPQGWAGKAIFDATQVYHIKIDVAFSQSFQSKYEVGLNFLPLLYFTGMKLMDMKDF